MTSYFQLPIISYLIYGICAVILMAGALYILATVSVSHLKKRTLLCAVALNAVVLFVLQGLNDVICYRRGYTIQASVFARVIGNLHWMTVAFLLIVLAVIELLFYRKLSSEKKYMLTAGSIKESLDKLPDGVCFFESGGQPLLVNMQMHKISEKLLGTELLNVETFWNSIKDKKVKCNAEIMQTEPTVIIWIDEENVWDFHLNLLNIKHCDIYELIAYNVAEQYGLSMELKQRNERLSAVNERLRLFSREMVNFTAEKELLEAKTKVHDDVGRSLLAFRSYLAQKPENRDRKSLLFLWKNVISVMKKETAPVGDWDLLEKTAKSLRVDIRLSGEFPENIKLKTAILAAIRECLTNTARHAQGDLLCVSISSDDEAFKVELTNTGKVPDGEIQESGGLKNLRHIVERAGGTMTIEGKPKFMLKLEFATGGKNEWSRQEY